MTPHTAYQYRNRDNELLYIECGTCNLEYLTFEMFFKDHPGMKYDDCELKIK